MVKDYVVTLEIVSDVPIESADVKEAVLKYYLDGGRVDWDGGEVFVVPRVEVLMVGGKFTQSPPRSGFKEFTKRGRRT
jgi:hypothetical protein